MGWDFDHFASDVGHAAEDLAQSANEGTSGIAPGKRTRTQHLPPRSSRAGLNLEPSTLRFLGTRVDEISEPKTVTITNPLKRPLEVLDLIQQPGNGHGAEFVLEGLIGNTTVAPGATLEVSFTFRPRPAEGRHRTGGYAIDTSEGPLAMIHMVGHARPSLDEAVATGSRAARREAEEKDLAKRQEAWTRTARVNGPIAWGPTTYADMESAVAAACQLGAAGSYDDAHEIVVVVEARLRELSHPDRVQHVLDTYDIAPNAPLMELGTAKDAVRGLGVRTKMRWSIAEADTLHRFQVGGKMIRLLTGESNDASVYQAFDQATWVTAGVAAAPVLIATAVAAPELVAPLVNQAMATIATEAGLMWAATRGAFAWAFNYLARNPDEGVAWAEFIVGLGFSAGEDPDQFLADLQTVEGWNNIIRDILFSIGPVRAGGGGKGADLEEPPQGASGPRRGGRGRGGQEPAGEEGGRVLPPAVRRKVDGESPGKVERARRLGREGLDRMMALADAVRARKQAVTVGRARSSATRDGEDHPQTADDDAALVQDHDVSLRERRDQSLHKRRVARADARDELYEAERAESAILVGDLRKEGGKVVSRVDDELTGDTFITIEMPNRRRVGIRERGNAPPREVRPRDPKRAGELQHEAVQAKHENARRDTQLATALAGAVEVDAAGAEHVLLLADKVIAGGGPAAVMDYATLPGRSGKVVAENGQEVVDVRTYAVSDQAEVSWDGRDISTGQPPGEYSKLPLQVSPGDLLDTPTRFTPAQAYADAATITRDRTGMPVLRGWKVVAMESVPDASWRVSGAARRLKLESATGQIRYVYARTVDIIGGLGPARMPSDAQYGAPAGATNDPGAATRRAELEGAGVVVSAEGHLANARSVKKVLISGGGATSPWNGALVAKRDPDAQIHWAARAGGANAKPARAQIAQNAERQDQISRELNAVELDLTLSFDPPERVRLLEKQDALRQEAAYLAQRERDLNFGDAMLDRNIDPEGPFSNPNVTMLVKTVETITPVHDGDQLRARVKFSDGTEDVYDQVIVNHGSDNDVDGSPGRLVASETLQVKATATRAHLESSDGAVRVAGAASFVTRKGAAPRSTPDDASPVPFEQDSGFGKQPPYSREVPSFYWAGEQIREMNEP